MCVPSSQTVLNQAKARGHPPTDEAKKHCMKMTLSIFARVDKSEKGGGATMGTVTTSLFPCHCHWRAHCTASQARTFMIVATFFDVLNEFDPTNSDNLDNLGCEGVRSFPIFRFLIPLACATWHRSPLLVVTDGRDDEVRL